MESDDCKISDNCVMLTVCAVDDGDALAVFPPFSVRTVLVLGATLAPFLFVGLFAVFPDYVKTCFGLFSATAALTSPLFFSTEGETRR